MKKSLPFLIVFSILSVSGIAYGVDIFHKLNFSTQAASCNITSPVTGTVTLTPTSGDNVVDCSGMDITVSSGGKLILDSVKTADTSSSNDMGVVLKVRNLTIDSGGEVSADGKGYVVGSTDSLGNAANSLGSTGGAGGGHGGAGGEGNGDGTNPSGTPGQSNGNREMPLLLGGSGGTSGNGGLGGNGGGAIKVEASGTLTVNGVVSANGTDGAKSVDSLSSGGGGAGGSVWLEAEILGGSGLVRVNGGSTDQLAGRIGGGGGGGRLVMVCRSTNNFGGQVTALGGDGSQDGQAGSIIGPGCIPNTPSILKMFEGNGVSTRELVEGALTRNTTVSFASNLQDSNVGSTVRLQVELRQVSDSFTGVATNTQSSYVSSPKVCSAPVGDCGLVTVSGLTVSKEYKVRYRAQNNLGISSAWVELGTVGNTDFIVVGNPVGITKVSGDNQTGTVGQALGEPLVGKVVDAAGYGVPFESLTWSVRSGGGSTAVASGSTSVDGTISTTWTLGTTAGSNNNTVRLARMSGNTVVYSATYTASSVADVVAKYSIVAPSLSVINTNFSYEIRALDQYNNQTDYDGLLNIYPFLGDQVTPGTGTLTPASGTMSNGYLQISTGSYNYAESIRIKVEDVNLNEGFSNSILFVATAGTCPAIDIDSNRTWRAIDAPGGIYDCRGLGTFTVRAGVTFSLESYDNADTNWSNDYGVTILADNMVVENTGIINANALGYGPGRGPGCPNTTGIGASHGGYGSTSGGSSGYAPYGSVYQPSMLGSAGGQSDFRHALGGGSYKLLITGSLSLNGTLSANGGNWAGGWSGGGAGGSIWIETSEIQGTGLITSNGGQGEQNGGGSGGRIAVYYNTNVGNTFNFTNIQARGNNGGWGGVYGGAGTVYIEQKGVDVANQGWLYVNNNGYNGAYAGLVEGNYTFRKISLKNTGKLVVLGQASRLEVSSGSAFDGDSTMPRLRTEGTLAYSGSENLSVNGVDLEIAGEITGVYDFTLGTTLNGGMTLYANTWAHNNTNQYTFGNVQVGGLGTWTLVSYYNADSNWTNDYGVTLNLVGLVVDSGGKMYGDGLGYGPGKGPGCPNTTGIGASHGGYGSTSGGSSSIAPYGSVYQPTMLGSAGGQSDFRNSPGGGSVKLNISGALTVNGTLSMNGAGWAGGWSGGGAGGSIWIDTNEISGSGLITSNGSKGEQNGGGSGGRIAVYYNTNVGDSFNFQSIQARGNNGGWGGTYGGAGTIYIEQKGVDVANQGWLYVNNNGYNGVYAGLVEGNYTFRKISLKNTGKLVVLGQASRLEVSSGSAFDGDSSMPRLRTEGTLAYSGSENLSVNGVDLEIAGEITGVYDFTLGTTLNGGMTIYANTWAHNNTNQYTFGNVQVGGLGTMTLVPYYNADSNWTNDYGVTLNLAGLVVDSGGKMYGDGLGYGPGYGPGCPGTIQIGASHGGYGSTSGGSSSLAPYGNVYQPTMLGSAGGQSDGRNSPGGGSMKLNISGALVMNGTLSVNGAGWAGGWSGGGAGGSIWIDTNEISGSGLITSNGSRGDQYGGGSGGRIAVYYSTNVGNSFNFQSIQARGNTGGWGGTYGGAGTVYVEQKGVDTSSQGWLIVNNGNAGGVYAGLVEGNYVFKKMSLKSKGHLAVLGQNSVLNLADASAIDGDSSMPKLRTDGTFAYSGEGTLSVNGVDVEIKGEISGVTDFELGTSLNGGMTLYANTWAHNDTTPYTFGNVRVGALGTMTLISYYNSDSNWTNDYGVTLNLAGLTIDSGGKMYGDGLGYGPGYGPGCPNTIQIGASHGGYGSTSGGSSSLAPYGSVYQPTMLGSAGGQSDGRNSPGGGSVKLNVSGLLTMNGTLSMNGAGWAGGWSGGGAGGSIWIDTNEIAGSGLISSNGSRGDQYGGGSGGRIAVYYNTNVGDSFNFQSIQARGNTGGWGGTYGGAGTIYIEQKNVDTSNEGWLYVNNGNAGGVYAGLVEGNYVFKKMSLKSKGHLAVLGQNSVLNIPDASAIDGDSSMPKLRTDGTFAYSGAGTLSVNGVDVEIKGEISGVTDYELGTSLNGGMTLYANTWAHNNTTPYTFGNVRVGGLGTMTLIPYNNGDSDYTNDYAAKLVLSSLIVDANGLIHSNALGYPANVGPGIGTDPGDWRRGAGGYGGYGSGTGAALGGAPYGDIYLPRDLGSGGRGDAVSGGGAIDIEVSGDTQINGTISANGQSATGAHSGGGSGGSVLLSVGNISGTGSVTANGGNGDGNAGGASGGRIAVYYSDGTLPTLRSIGGTGTQYGGPGTIYSENKSLDTETKGNLSIDNQDRIGQGMDFTSGDWKFRQVTIGKNVTIWVKGDQVNNRGVIMEVSDLFTLDTGAKILGTGKGYDGGEGPGVGNNGQGQSGGGGGANGGDGGAGEGDGLYVATPGGVKYGDQLQPLVLGSGGGLSGTGTAGGNGGGAFGIVSKEGHIEILGDINMDGTNGLVGSPGGGGGAGGSILIYGDSCNITGNLSAKGGNGGDGDFDGGGGGGGRISILYVNGPCGVSGAVAYTGGTSPNGQVGQIGTFPPEPNSVPYPAGFQNQYEIRDEAELGMGGNVMASQMMFGYRETQLSDGVVLDYKAYDPVQELKNIIENIKGKIFSND